MFKSTHNFVPSTIINNHHFWKRLDLCFWRRQTEEPYCSPHHPTPQRWGWVEMKSLISELTFANFKQEYYYLLMSAQFSASWPFGLPEAQFWYCPKSCPLAHLWKINIYGEYHHFWCQLWSWKGFRITSKSPPARRQWVQSTSCRRPRPSGRPRRCSASHSSPGLLGLFQYQLADYQNVLNFNS